MTDPRKKDDLRGVYQGTPEVDRMSFLCGAARNLRT